MNSDDDQEPQNLNMQINLREHVKQWLKLDDEIVTLRNEIKKRRNLKRTMTNQLIQTMKNNDIDVMNAGTSKLVGTSPDKILSEVTFLLCNKKEYEKMSTANNPYGDGTSSKKILDECIKFLDANNMTI